MSTFITTMLARAMSTTTTAALKVISFPFFAGVVPMETSTKLAIAESAAIAATVPQAFIF